MVHDWKLGVFTCANCNISHSQRPLISVNSIIAPMLIMEGVGKLQGTCRSSDVLNAIKVLVHGYAIGT